MTQLTAFCKSSTHTPYSLALDKSTKERKEQGLKEKKDLKKLNLLISVICSVPKAVPVMVHGLMEVLQYSNQNKKEDRQ